MTRFYFPASRAHWAYCMALDHGLMYETRNGFWSLDGILSVTGAAGYKLVVAKECERLLEPRIGDVAQHPMNGNCYDLAGESCFEWFRSVGMKIIQRDGKPFAWPDRGEV